MLLFALFCGLKRVGGKSKPNEVGEETSLVYDSPYIVNVCHDFSDVLVVVSVTVLVWLVLVVLGIVTLVLVVVGAIRCGQSSTPAALIVNGCMIVLPHSYDW